MLYEHGAASAPEIGTVRVGTNSPEFAMDFASCGGQIGVMHSKRTPHIDARRGRRGQGMVEFALILPVFLFFLLMAVDFGRSCSPTSS